MIVDDGKCAACVLTCICPTFQGIFSQIHHFRASQGIFMQYSGRFPLRCTISEYPSAFSYNMENTHTEDIWKIHIGKFLENTYRGFFSEYDWGEFPVYDREGDFGKYICGEFFRIV